MVIARRFDVGEGEVVLLLLQEVQLQQRVEAVETGQQVLGLVGLNPVAGLRKCDMGADPVG